MSRGTSWITKIVLATLFIGSAQAEEVPHYKRNFDGSLAAGLSVKSGETLLKKDVPYDLTGEMRSNKKKWSLLFDAHGKAEGSQYRDNTLLLTLTGTSSGVERTVTCALDRAGASINTPEIDTDSINYTLASGQRAVPFWYPQSAKTQGAMIRFGHGESPDQPSQHSPRSLNNGTDRSDYWFSVDDGLLAFGQGKKQGENIRWVWRIAPTDDFEVTEVSLTSKRFDLIMSTLEFTTNRSSLHGTLNNELIKLVGGSVADITAAFERETNTERRSIATVRTLAGLPNPAGFIKDALTIMNKVDVSLSSKLPAKKNRWAMTFGTQGSSISGMRFKLTTSTGATALTTLEPEKIEVYTDVPADAGLPAEGSFLVADSLFPSTTSLREELSSWKTQWVQNDSGPYRQNFWPDATFKKYAFMFLTKNRLKIPFGFGTPPVPYNDRTTISTCWLAFDNGILASGQGGIPGENIVWAWRLFPGEKVDITDLSVEHIYGGATDLFDIVFKNHNGLPSLKTKIEEFIGPEDGTRLIEAMPDSFTYSRNVIAKLRTWMGWENPTSGWTGSIVDLPYKTKVSLIDKMGSVDKNNWFTTFRLKNYDRFPLNFQLTDSNDQVSTIEILDKKIVLQGPINANADLGSAGSSFSVTEPFANHWKAATGYHDHGKTNAVVIDYSYSSNKYQTPFESTGKEYSYWFGLCNNYVAFGRGTKPTQDSIIFSWLLSPEGHTPFDLKGLNVEMVPHEYAFQPTYVFKDGKHVMVKDYTKLTERYSYSTQALYAPTFAPSTNEHEQIYKEKLEKFVMERDPTAFNAYKNELLEKEKKEIASVHRRASGPTKAAADAARLLAKIRTTLGWDKNDVIEPGSLSIHNRKENNPLKEDALSAPSACHLRFDVYDSEKLTVLLKDTDGNAVHDVRIGWGEGITLQGRDEKNADYTKEAGNPKEKIWIDYHNNTLSIGTIGADGTPVLQLAAANSGEAKPVTSFSILESSTTKRTQLVMLDNTTFAPATFTQAYQNNLSAGDKPLETDLSVAVPADFASSWAMTFETDRKTECVISVDSAGTPLHRLTLGKTVASKEFFASEMTSYVPEGYAGLRCDTLINNGTSSKDEMWQMNNDVVKDSWELIERTNNSKVVSTVQGYEPKSKYLREPAKEGELTTHWVIYHHNFMAFGHGDTPGQGVGYVWQPTIQTTALPTHVRLRLTEGNMKNVSFNPADSATYDKLISDYKNVVMTDSGANKEVLKILDKTSAKMVYHVDPNTKLSRTHHIPLPASARANQQVALTFKTPTLAVIPGFSETMKPGIQEYWLQIAANEFPGKMVAYYHDKKGESAPQIHKSYSYDGNKKTWGNDNPDGGEGSDENILLKFVPEDSTLFPHAHLKKNNDMWIVFDKGWLAYGQGSKVGENIGMVWYFVPGKNRRPINYLTLGDWQGTCTYHDIKFITQDSTQWQSVRNKLESRFVKQLPESDPVAAAFRTEVTNTRPDTLRTTSTTERKEIALPADSLQSWVCTFDAVYKKRKDGEGKDVISNKDMRFFVETKTDAENPDKNSAYIVRLNTGYLEFISDPGKLMDDGSTRENVTNQIYRLNRGSNGKPFDIWTTSGPESNRYLAHLWVNGGDNGLIGINNNNGRIHPYTEDSAGNNVTKAKHWLCYHDGYLATGLGDGPAADGSNVGLIWKMKPHMGTKTDNPRAVQRLSVASTDGTEVMLTNVATRMLIQSDEEDGQKEASYLHTALNTMISGKRKGRLRGGLDKPAADLVNYMRKELDAGLAPEALIDDAEDNKILLATPMRKHHAVKVPNELLATQRFFITFKANTRSRMLMSPLGSKNESLCPFFISQWLTAKEADESGEKAFTAGIYGKIMKQKFPAQYIKKTLDGGFQEAKGADLITGASSTDTHISIKGQPLKTTDGSVNPMLTVPNESKQYWFYYDGQHISFGHGSSPSSGTVGFTWKLLEPLSAAIHSFAFYADVNLLLTPPIEFKAPIDADSAAVTQAITNQEIADILIGKEITAPQPANITVDKPESEKEVPKSSDTGADSKPVETTDTETKKDVSKTEESTETAPLAEEATEKKVTDETKPADTTTGDSGQAGTTEGAGTKEDKAAAKDEEVAKDTAVDSGQAGATEGTGATKDTTAAKDAGEAKDVAVDSGQAGTTGDTGATKDAEPDTWTDLGDTNNQFLLTFNAKSSSSFKIAFANNDTESHVYAVELGANKAAGSRIFKAGSTEPASSFETGIPNNAFPTNYWLAYKEGRFVLGLGYQPEGDALLSWHDTSPLTFNRCTLVGAADSVFTVPVIGNVESAARYFSAVATPSTPTQPEATTTAPADASAAASLATGTGNGLAREEDWKPEWQFSDTVDTVRFDLKRTFDPTADAEIADQRKTDAIIALGPSIEAGKTANTYRIRLSHKFGAQLIEGDNDRRVKEVAEFDAMEASKLPNDNEFHSFMLSRKGGGAEPTVITLRSWNPNAVKEEDHRQLLTFTDTTEPVEITAFTFAWYDKEVSVENVQLVKPSSSEVATQKNPDSESLSTGTEEVVAQQDSAPSRKRAFSRIRRRNRSTRNILEENR